MRKNKLFQNSEKHLSERSTSPQIPPVASMSQVLENDEEEEEEDHTKLWFHSTNMRNGTP